jgi:hypothetical protein
MSELTDAQEFLPIDRHRALLPLAKVTAGLLWALAVSPLALLGICLLGLGLLMVRLGGLLTLGYLLPLVPAEAHWHHVPLYIRILRRGGVPQLVSRDATGKVWHRRTLGRRTWGQQDS